MFVFWREKNKKQNSQAWTFYQEGSQSLNWKEARQRTKDGVGTTIWIHFFFCVYIYVYIYYIIFLLINPNQ